MCRVTSPFVLLQAPVLGDQASSICSLSRARLLYYVYLHKTICAQKSSCLDEKSTGLSIHLARNGSFSSFVFSFWQVLLLCFFCNDSYCWSSLQLLFHCGGTSWCLPVENDLSSTPIIEFQCLCRLDFALWQEHHQVYFAKFIARDQSRHLPTIDNILIVLS